MPADKRTWRLELAALVLDVGGVELADRADQRHGGKVVRVCETVRNARKPVSARIERTALIGDSSRGQERAVGQTFAEGIVIRVTEIRDQTIVPAELQCVPSAGPAEIIGDVMHRHDDAGRPSSSEWRIQTAQ